MALYDHIVACNTHDLSKLRPFVVAGELVGWVGADLAAKLRRWPAYFAVADDRVAMADGLADGDARSAAIAEVGAALAAQGALPPARDELYPVTAAYGRPPLLALDRGWVPAFGTIAFGVHVNGYVDAPAGPQLWIGTRSADSRVDPGKFDNMVAGGQPVGLTLEQNVVKEAEEEASVPEALARQARPAGAITYAMAVPSGLRRDVLFVYDLPVPEAFHPASRDGEHSGFQLMPAAEALRLVDQTDRFKFNVNLVIIDFAIRHGVLRPDHPDYLRLNAGLQNWA